MHSGLEQETQRADQLDSMIYLQAIRSFATMRLLIKSTGIILPLRLILGNRNMSALNQWTENGIFVESRVLLSKDTLVSIGY